MRLSISNIAWDVVEDKQVLSLLKRYNVDAIDIAPGKYFSDIIKTTDSEITRIKDCWLSQGIDIVGMQALLFGTSGFNMFGSASVQSAMLEHLESVCRIGAGLGAIRLVFGSPRNRDSTGLTSDQVNDVAIDFFNRLGNIASQYNLIVCLEPNPVSYGANFMIDSKETARVVRSVGHPSILMQLDSGAIAINNENLRLILEENSDIIGHIHISEPNLTPLGAGLVQHDEFADCLRNYLPNHIVCIETLPDKSVSNLISIEKSLKAAAPYYI
jgi:D-psicose/D-tagatose/L-ribulose 3-epimerase